MRFNKTLKKVWIPVVAASFVLMSFVFAQAQTDKPRQHEYYADGSNSEGDRYDNESQEHGVDTSGAQIGFQEAIGAASAAYPDYSARGAEIEKERGHLVYAVTMVNPTGKALEVKVDAGTAKVLGVDNDFYEHENGKGDEAERGREWDSEENDVE